MLQITHTYDEAAKTEYLSNLPQMFSYLEMGPLQCS